MSTSSLLRKVTGLHSLEPLVDAAAAYDAEMEKEEEEIPTTSDAARGGEEDIKHTREVLFTRVLDLSRPLGVRGALAWLTAVHAGVFALSPPMGVEKIKWLQNLRVPFYAPSSKFCAVLCASFTALAVNAGFRILSTDANACYDHYVRNGLRRRARCLGVPEIVCPIARLVARFSGSTRAADAQAPEFACPLTTLAPPSALEHVASKPAAAQLAPGPLELNISASSKGVEGSHQTTALPTPRSASLRTRSFALPDDADAAIGVAAAHDSDEDTAWETDEVIEAVDGSGARLVPGLHYQSQHTHGHRRKHHHHLFPHRRQRSYDSSVGIGDKMPWRKSPVSPGSSPSSPAVAGRGAPVVLADPVPNGDAASTSQASTASPSAAVAAHAPLLSRAAFIVRFEQHRRTALRLYLGVQASRLTITTLFATQHLGACCLISVLHAGLLTRLRSELAYIDCSARASIGPIVAWSWYTIVLGCHLCVLNRAVQP